MFGSGDQGFGTFYSLSKMMQSINEMKAPMNQFAGALSLKSQLTAIEMFSKQSSLMERITNATLATDKIGKYLQVTNQFKVSDNMLGVKNVSAIANVSKAWRDEFNATLSISRLVQESSQNALANFRGSIIDSDFNKALFRASSLFETFSKFNGVQPSWKEVKTAHSENLNNILLLDKEDVALGTKILNQAITNIENAQTSGLSISEQLELLNPLKERRDDETDTSPFGFTRREFFQLAINQIISLLLAWTLGVMMSADQGAKDNARHQEVLVETAQLQLDTEQILSDVDLLKKEVFKDAFRICIKSTFIREDANTKSRIIARVNIDDVVISPFDSARNNGRWLKVHYLNEENCKLSGWALRARFRTE
jgi:hypothetical protein